MSQENAKTAQRKFRKLAGLCEQYGLVEQGKGQEAAAELVYQALAPQKPGQLENHGLLVATALAATA